jgi:hypothetical protein
MTCAISLIQRSKAFVTMRLPIATTTLGRSSVSERPFCLVLLLGTVNSCLKQGHTHNIIVPQIHTLEALMHPECKGHEEPILRFGSDVGIPLQRIKISSARRKLSSSWRPSVRGAKEPPFITLHVRCRGKNLPSFLITTNRRRWGYEPQKNAHPTFIPA